MACKTPITIRDANKVATAVPCMKCHDCRLARTRQWVFRIQEERKHHLNCYFITLTYETTPKTPNGLGTLDGRDLQLFFKRLRKRTKQTIKYLAVGEYGSIRRRPHYHALLLGSIEESDIRAAWEKHVNESTGAINGHAYIDTANSGAATAYVVKYLDKGRVIPLFASDDRLKERSWMSKGLGSRYLTPEMISWHRRAPDGWSIQSEGQTSPLPRYFKNRIFGQIFDKETGREIADFRGILSEKMQAFKQKMEDRYWQNVAAFGSELAYVQHVYWSDQAKDQARRLYNQTKSRMDF
ncbi:replication initiator protein [Apis mellifera associated microvirus 56]|nr:replication initiator protein [Apis mellifera associated microvirus 56]